MARQSIEQQADVTLKVMLALVAAPAISAPQLAKIVGKSPSAVARIISRLKDAGIKIDYDFGTERYQVHLSAAFKKSVLGELAAQLSSAVKKKTDAPMRFVQELDRYSLPQFGKAFGYTPSNVYNMITGYNNSKLPSGWVAYQIRKGTKWQIQRMTRDRSGTEWTLPPNVERDASRYVIGTGPELGTVAGRKSQCKIVEEDGARCPDNVMAKELCQKHYYLSRKKPEEFRHLRIVS